LYPQHSLLGWLEQADPNLGKASMRSLQQTRHFFFFSINTVSAR
jgi:LytS/YehU family sensor histidine kinase